MPYGTGLDTSFNQDEPQQNINTHPKKVKTPEGLKNVKQSVDYDKIQHLKVGEMVAYSKGQGTIIRKDGAYVTIFNEDANAHDQVHAGETYIPGDTISMGIMNQLWDQMNYETRMASLHKAEVQEPLHFVDRKWNELPLNLKDVIKLSPTSVSTGSKYRGGKRPTTVGNDKQQERSAYNPGEGYGGGSGQSRTFTPGGKKPGKKETKPASEEGQRRAHSTGVQNERKRGQEVMSRAAQSGLDIMTAKPKDGKGVTFADIKQSLNQVDKLSPSSVSVGYGVKDVPAGARQDKNPTGSKGSKGSKEKQPAANSLLGQHEAGKQEQHVRNHIAVANAPKAGLDIMTAKKPKKEDPGAGTFAQGLDKATSYGELATEIYKIRNQLNKVTGGKIPGEKLGDLPQGKNRLKPVVPGQTKIETSEGERTLTSPADRYGTSSSERNWKTGTGPSEGDNGTKNLERHYANTKAGKVDGKTDFSGLGGKEDPFDKKLIGGVEKVKPLSEPGDVEEQNNVSSRHSSHNSDSDGQIGSANPFKKSDVEHGAYGGVVTDTQFDATEDYEEKRPEVCGKEFDHNHQQKTPRDPKEDGKEVLVGYHSKEGDGGSMSTGTEGANNPRYNAKYDPDEDGYKEKAISFRNKNNTRYGPRTVSREEAMEIWKKSGIKPSKPKTRADFTGMGEGGDYVQDTSDWDTQYTPDGYENHSKD
jgi:hypothetical protein